MADDLVLTPLEVARLLRVSDVTVRRMISRGYLPRIPGVRVVLIPRTAVDYLLLGELRGGQRGAGPAGGRAIGRGVGMSVGPKLANGLRVYAMRSGRPADMLFADEMLEALGYEPKVAASIIDRLARKGWIEYGVSARSGWLTPAGWIVARSLPAA